MKASIEQFRQNLVHVRNLATIYAELHQNGSILDLSDILRAEVVLAVSALDNFIHDLVRLGMVEILQDQRKRTKFYQEVKISMNVVGFNDKPYHWFEGEIRRRYQEESFQRPDKIADAIKRISEINLWEKVATEILESEESIKNELKGIVNRRNFIAHESDLEPNTPGKRFDIDDMYVEKVVKFIEKLAEAIYKVVI